MSLQPECNYVLFAVRTFINFALIMKYYLRTKYHPPPPTKPFSSPKNNKHIFSLMANNSQTYLLYCISFMFSELFFAFYVLVMVSSLFFFNTPHFSKKHFYFILQTYLLEESVY